MPTQCQKSFQTAGDGWVRRIWEKFGTVSYLSVLSFMCVAKQLVQTNRQPSAGASSCTPSPFTHTNAPQPSTPTTNEATSPATAECVGGADS